MRESFLQTPAMKPGSRGVLDMHYKDRVYPLAVHGNMGKKLPVGESGLSVEIVEYYADAVVQGKFRSEGVEPKNPMLQLHVYVPGQKEPLAEIAYATRPLVNLESIKKQSCPVKFWYHHPAIAAPMGAEFLRRRTESCTAGFPPAASTSRAAKSRWGTGSRSRPISRSRCSTTSATPAWKGVSPPSSLLPAKRAKRRLRPWSS